LTVGFFDRFTGGGPEAQAAREASAKRQEQIKYALLTDSVAPGARRRLEGARSGSLPWIATLTPAELLITRSHGIKPIASVSATCWMHYGWSWTLGHQQGWQTALRRLREEARVAGANAVLDVKMRTVPLRVEESMDFTLVGTAVRVEGLPPSEEPIVATVPALEFVKLLDADVVPTGIAVGAHYEWYADWQGDANKRWMGNVESVQLSRLWERVRQRAHADLRKHARDQGNGVLAHINFSQMFEGEGSEALRSKQYLARHIVIATTVDARRGARFPHEINIVVDMHAGGTPLTGTARHHQSYQVNDEEGGI
jgi:uncharacterized protein YbjQ (UPF0145 family)